MNSFRSKLFPFLPEDLGGQERSGAGGVVEGAGGVVEGAGRRTRFSAVSKGSIDLLRASGGGRQAKLPEGREGLQGLGGSPRWA